MDTRRREPRPQGPPPSAGADDAELVELQGVGPARASRLTAGVILAIVAVSASILGLALLGRTPAPVPSPASPPPLAVAPSAWLPGESQPGPTAALGQRPTSVARTPAPSAAPWQFREQTAGAPAGTPTIDRIWAVGDRFIALADGLDADDRQGQALFTSGDGVLWRAGAGPGAALIGAAVSDGDELWALTRPDGDEPAPWTMHSTTTAKGWTVHETNGLGKTVRWVNALARGAGGWLAAVSVGDDPRLPRAELRFSTTGVDWVATDLEVTMTSTIDAIATDGQRWLALSTEFPAEGVSVLSTWTSDDGLHWAGGDQTQIHGIATGLAGGRGRFVVTGFEDVNGTVEGRAWWSDDGRTWDESGFDAMVPAPAAAAVTALPDGSFLTISANGNGDLWRSLDGQRWDVVHVLPAGLRQPAFAIAVLGDVVVIAGPTTGAGPRFWTGSLSLLPVLNQ